MSLDAQTRARRDATRIVENFQRWFRDVLLSELFFQLPATFWPMLTEMISQELLPHLQHEEAIVGKLMQMGADANERTKRLESLMAALEVLKKQKVLILPSQPTKPK